MKGEGPSKEMESHEALLLAVMNRVDSAQKEMKCEVNQHITTEIQFLGSKMDKRMNVIEEQIVEINRLFRLLTAEKSSNLMLHTCTENRNSFETRQSGRVSPAITFSTRPDKSSMDVLPLVHSGQASMEAANGEYACRHCHRKGTYAQVSSSGLFHQSDCARYSAVDDITVQDSTNGLFEGSVIGEYTLLISGSAPIIDSAPLSAEHDHADGDNPADELSEIHFSRRPRRTAANQPPTAAIDTTTLPTTPATRAHDLTTAGAKSEPGSAAGLAADFAASDMAATADPPTPNPNSSPLPRTAPRSSFELTIGSPGGLRSSGLSLVSYASGGAITPAAAAAAGEPEAERRRLAVLSEVVAGLMQSNMNVDDVEEEARDTWVEHGGAGRRGPACARRRDREPGAICTARPMLYRKGSLLYT
jgi:hypothetical protein